MKKYENEQDTAAKPPEPQGEQTPEEPEEETDGVEWDGSEAELVADESAAEYEEYNTGIALRYTLKEQEIFPVLVKTQYTQRRIALSVAAALIGLVLAVFYLVSGTAHGQGGYTAIGVACLLVVVIVVPSPLFHLLSSAKGSADGREIRMKIYPDHIEIGTEGEIPLDGTVQRLVIQNLIALYIGDQMIILPLRCVEPAVLPEVQAMILAGTQPLK